VSIVIVKNARNDYLVAMSIKPATNGETAALRLAAREGWPPELRALIERYPREVWAGHENLGQMAQFWLSRHGMFREFAAMLEDATARFRDGAMPPETFAQFFAPRLQFMLQQLQAHHQIEDFHYFPIFRKAEDRLVRGFDILENDHHELHENIDTTVVAANDFLRALGGDTDAQKRTGEAYAERSAELFRGLKRHLDDEEDLIVPLILDRGEDRLGVGHG
jgi:hemerythrin-like domain-containing protein